MNKSFFIWLLLLIIPIVTCGFFAHEIIAKKPLYLHEQKKDARSNEEHLKQFTMVSDVILVFYADWCNPCKRMSPFIDAVALSLFDFTFIKINRDFFMDLANIFNITSIPTLIFLRDGKEIGRYDGKPLTKKELEKLITTTYNK